MLNNFFNSSKQNKKLEEAQYQLLSIYKDVKVNQNVQDKSESIREESSQEEETKKEAKEDTEEETEEKTD
ncbi:4335_t:CDS:2, partial [Gigaspora margarita]